MILCGSYDFVRRFMLGAHRNDMTSGDYVFISLGLLPPDDIQHPWLRNDEEVIVLVVVVVVVIVIVVVVVVVVVT